jgi:drug/metabolite transporter (DMT)-like permease
MMTLYLALTISATLAAAGQVLLKLGVNGQASALAMANPKVLGGLTLYAAGMLIWLWALSQLPLQVVYPFTMLTLILVFIASIVVFGERPSGLICLGWAVVGVGVAIVAYAGSGAARA